MITFESRKRIVTSNEHGPYCKNISKRNHSLSISVDFTESISTPTLFKLFE